MNIRGFVTSVETKRLKGENQNKYEKIMIGKDIIFVWDKSLLGIVQENNKVDIKYYLIDGYKIADSIEVLDETKQENKSDSQAGEYSADAPA